MRSRRYLRLFEIGHNTTYGRPHIAFNLTETMIALALENEVTVYDLSILEPLIADTSHIGDITGMAFSPDGSLFAAASTDGTVTVWRLE